jgi:hypothetical protein
MDCSASDIVCGLVEAWQWLGLRQWIPDTVASACLTGWEKLSTSMDVKTLGSLLFGAGGFYLSWLRRDAKIFERLERILAQEEPRLRHARADVLAILMRPAPALGFEKPIFAISSLREVLKRRNWESTLRSSVDSTRPEKQINKALKLIVKQEQLGTKFRTSYKQQENTAYLLLGAIASARAERSKDEVQRASLRGKALERFNDALAVEGFQSDADALELKGIQLIASRDYSAGRNVFDEMAKHVAENRNPILDKMQGIRAEYFRYLCTFLQAQAKDSGNIGLGTARSKLVDVTTKLMPPGELVGRELIDKARIFELLAAIRLRLSENVQGPEELARAKAAYDLLKGQNIKRVRSLRVAGRIAERERQTLFQAATEGLVRCEALKAEFEKLRGEPN